MIVTKGFKQFYSILMLVIFFHCKTKFRIYGNNYLGYYYVKINIGIPP